MANNPLCTSKTPGIIFAEILMMNAGFKGIHFLVEGDDDSHFWKGRLSRSNTNIVVCEGKTNLVGATALALSATFAPISGIYDADFDRHFGISHHPGALAVTDQNDLETTFLASAALDAVLYEYADVSLIYKFENEKGKTIVEHIQTIASEFGILRLLNKIRGYGVNFDDVSPYRFISIDKWELDTVALRSYFADLCGITENDLIAEIASTCPAATKWDFCQGHDSVRILAQGLKQRIGKRQFNEHELMRVLRIAYSDAILHKSTMCLALKAIDAKLPKSIFEA